MVGIEEDLGTLSAVENRTGGMDQGGRLMATNVCKA